MGNQFRVTIGLLTIGQYSTVKFCCLPSPWSIVEYERLCYFACHNILIQAGFAMPHSSWVGVGAGVGSGLGCG